MKQLLCCLILIAAVPASAQRARHQADTVQAAAVAQQVTAQRFVFRAEYVLPIGSSSRLLTPRYYDLTVTKDSVISNLPYFGRVFSPTAINVLDVGLKFTLTHFSYTTTRGRKGSWEVTIVPRDNAQISRLLLTVQQNGSAYLQVNCANRDPISYTGYVGK